jgi:hypothetical protein
MPRQQSLITDIVILIAVIGTLTFLVYKSAAELPVTNTTTATSTHVSAGAAALMAMSTQATSSATNTSATSTAPSTKTAPVKNIPKQSQKVATTSVPEITRVENPYMTPPLTPGDINITTRAALVNIFCYPHGGSLNPISGSGVIIDSRGVILTNAHVAQYVLLSESSLVDLSCVVRTGSPATAQWIPQVLYIPPVWVAAHAAEIHSQHPLGTGEHDYALLYINAAVSPNTPLPTGGFPSITPDTREAITFVGDTVLVASYPAEFIASAAEFNLYSAASFSTVQQFLTFSTSSVDAISVGSVIEAQSGSSGGAIVNDWGRLVGLITTTSEGTTTAARDLRGITTAYINRDLAAQTGFDLNSILGGDPAAETNDFTAHTAPALIQLFVNQLTQ